MDSLRGCFPCLPESWMTAKVPVFTLRPWLCGAATRHDRCQQAASGWAPAREVPAARLCLRVRRAGPGWQSLRPFATAICSRALASTWHTVYASFQKRVLVEIWRMNKSQRKKRQPVSIIQENLIRDLLRVYLRGF